MNILETIEKLVNFQDLDASQMSTLMKHTMEGHVSTAQIAVMLTALRMKGETIEEIAAAVQTTQQYITPCPLSDLSLIDIVGTGGDGANLFNISTTAAFVVAAAGGVVAKHMNRLVSSTSGSADVLEMAGINFDLSADETALCVRTLGIGFLFAPRFRSGMRYAGLARKEMGFRTLFNILGPLTNPAQAKKQLIGVYDEKWLYPLAEVLKQLGSTHALVVHAKKGLDEMSLEGETDVAELNKGVITRYTLHPQQFNIPESSLYPLKVNNPQESLTMMLQVFANKPGPAKNIVAFNAGAALYAGDICSTIQEGIDKANAVIANGSAKDKFEALIRFSQALCHAKK